MSIDLAQAMSCSVRLLPNTTHRFRDRARPRTERQDLLAAASCQTTQVLLLRNRSCCSVDLQFACDQSTRKILPGETLLLLEKPSSNEKRMLADLTITNMGRLEVEYELAWLSYSTEPSV